MTERKKGGSFSIGIPSHPLPEGIDPAHFRTPTDEEWGVVPQLLQRALVTHCDEDNDPRGLALRRIIIAFNEASLNEGWLPITLAMKRSPRCQYGEWKYNKCSYYYEYKRKCRKKKGGQIKALRPDAADDFKGMYEAPVYHSNGNKVLMSLKHSDMAFLSSSKASASDFDKNEYDVVEVQVNIQRYIEEALKLPCSNDDAFDNKYVRHKKRGKWAYAANRMKNEGGFTYPTFTFTTESKKIFQCCGMAFVPVILNGGGPVLIQADAAHLVHKDDVTCNMKVRIGNLTFDATHGTRQMPKLYWQWLDSASSKRARNSSSGDDGNARKKSKTTAAAPQKTKNISKEDATDVDIFCSKAEASHIGTRKYRDMVMDLGQKFQDQSLIKNEKTDELDALHELILEQGSRFLRKQGGTQLLRALDEKEARIKIRHDVAQVVTRKKA